jgi:hypothetical protein
VQVMRVTDHVNGLDVVMDRLAGGSSQLVRLRRLQQICCRRRLRRSTAVEFVEKILCRRFVAARVSVVVK